MGRPLRECSMEFGYVPLTQVRVEAAPSGRRVARGNLRVDVSPLTILGIRNSSKKVRPVGQLVLATFERP